MISSSGGTAANAGTGGRRGEKHKRYIVLPVFRPFEHTNTFSPTPRDTGGGVNVFKGLRGNAG